MLFDIAYRTGIRAQVGTIFDKQRATAAVTANIVSKKQRGRRMTQKKTKGEMA